ncbi:MAG: 4Fe-4S binding protein [Candidatus Ranarchaeia archaeon]|jgi:dihydropyrimidine dehydrogenase (NAD+) subunit PreA
MASLETTFLGVKLDNPLILASASPGWDGKNLQRIGNAGAGAVIPKSIGSPDKWFQHPRNGRMVIYRRGRNMLGMQNIEIFSTQGTEKWIKTDLALAAKGKAPIFVSFVANPDPNGTYELAKTIAKTGVPKVLELNVSCPMPAAGVGWNIGRDAKLVQEQVKAAKEGAPDIPLMPKLTPNVADIGSIAKAAEKAGADGIAGINSIRSLVGIDIDTGKPLLQAFGGYTGPAIKPIALRCVAEIAQSVKIPVSGIGGVNSWRDAVEMMMVGANTVQIATAVIWHGPKVFNMINKGILRFMKAKGYDSPEDFVGKALPYLTTTEEIAKKPKETPEVDAETCNACKRCIEVCVYDAITLEDNIAQINADMCDGCGLCIQICPQDSISFKLKR